MNKSYNSTNVYHVKNYKNSIPSKEVKNQIEKNKDNKVIQNLGKSIVLILNPCQYFV